MNGQSSMFRKFPFFFQHDAMDCGPACLAMVSQYYGKKYTLQYLRDLSFITREGVSLTGLTEACNTIGLESMAVRISLEELIRERPFPCILYWNNAHFIILYDIKTNPFTKKKYYKISDPAKGKITLTEEQLLEGWANEERQGVAFLMETTETFFKIIPEKSKEYNFRFLAKYLTPYKKDFIQLIFSLGIGSIITLIIPFLTQTLIDTGVGKKQLDIVSILLLAQIALFLGSVIIEIVRNWLIVYIGARINILIISDFFKKVLKLPLRFFDTKFSGDFYQRINDHSRIEQFLTSESLTTFFSLINFSVFLIVLLRYDIRILGIYLVLTFIAIFWSRLFLAKREKLDYFRFKSSALNQQSINEMINGIQDIKLNNFEEYNINGWRKIQKDVFKINLDILKVDQLQLIGFDFINQLKNIIITFIAAREVILGNITLGALLSISYIIGQMNSPINQLIVFFRSLQDAQLSMKRLTEVQNHREEEEEHHIRNIEYSDKTGINIKDLSFQFEGPHSPRVLDNINIFIPEGKTTAIVGASGSGKTTLMKLLLQFYPPTSGNIEVNKIPLSEISPSFWREKCGVVMQDGYIFAETIERNIATKEEKIDQEKLHRAIKIANIGDYVYTLPNKESTMIGSMGNGISGGQKQRLLLARAIYKNPDYIFLDEATSALDAKNEKIIHEGLYEFFKNKTVVIIAHRLSTIKSADQIIVLHEGKAVESGSHQTLMSCKGVYYDLINNQINTENKNDE